MREKGNQERTLPQGYKRQQWAMSVCFCKCQNAPGEELKNLGCDIAFIGYTYLEKWYGKLGYKTIVRYWMGEKDLKA